MASSILDEESSPVTGLAVSPAREPALDMRDSAPQLRAFGDTAATRKMIYENALSAASEFEPVSNQRHQLALQNVRYIGPEDYSVNDQKSALLSRGTLSRRLPGEWVLSDNEGNEVSRKRATVAKIPHLTDRGTFILNGTEWSMASQFRLRPGVFTRVKDNGEIESHVNVSIWYGHRVYLDPKTGIFRLMMGQARIPLYPLMKSMGVSDKKLREVWGNELTAANMAKADPQAMKKLYQKLYKNRPADNEQDMTESVVNAFREMELDPEVTAKTLGRPHRNMDADAFLDVTGKLLNVGRGEADPDDRDAISISESFAKRLSSEHTYQHNLGCQWAYERCG